jgi:chain length determinant protein EpsF
VVDSLKLAEDPQTVEKFNNATKGRGDIRNWLADQLLENMEAKPARDSSVIRISCTGHDPEEAANLANAFARSYIETSLELKVEPARNQSLWFEEQIKTLRLAFEEAQKALSDYQQETGIISLDEKLDVESSRLAELSSQLVAAQEHTFETMARLRQATAASDKGRLAEAPEILNSPLIQDLKTELARAEARFAEISERLDTQHPQYQRTRAEIDSLRSQINKEMERARGSISNTASETKQREEKLKASLEQQKARVLEVKQQRDRLNLLKGTVERAQRAFDNTTQRADLIRLESQRSQTEIAVLNVAVPPLKHSKPRLLLNLVVAMLVGLILGIGAATLAELLDRPIRSPDDIVDSLELPMLAIFPPQASPAPQGAPHSFP